MRTCSCKNLHMNVHSSIIYSSHKVETTEMSIKGWANRMWHSHLIGMLMIKKKNEILIHPVTGISFEDIMLRERSQTPRATYCMPTFTWVPNNRFTKTDIKAASPDPQWERHWLLIPWGVFLKVQKCFKVQLWRQWHTSRDILRKYS